MLSNIGEKIKAKYEYVIVYMYILLLYVHACSAFLVRWYAAIFTSVPIWYTNPPENPVNATTCIPPMTICLTGKYISN